MDTDAPVPLPFAGFAPPLGGAKDDAPTSPAWHCASCGALAVYNVPTPRPSVCTGCGSADLHGSY